MDKKPTYEELEERIRGLEKEGDKLRLTEESLNSAWERLFYLFTSSPAVIYSAEIKINYPCTFISENIKALLGYDPEEFIRDPNFWIDHIHPKDKHFFLNSMECLFEQGYYIHEYRFQHKDSTYRWIRDEVRLVWGAKGNPAEIIGSLIDITTRKEAEESLKKAYQELQSTQSQLIQSAKLASIGELVAGVAHELNQPLMVIRTIAQFIIRSIKTKKLSIKELPEHLEAIERNTKRMMNIINHLRTFSRQSQSDFLPVNINKVIEDALLMVGEQLHLHNIEVKVNLGSEIPEVKGDANQLEQVILNLLTNAKDAILSDQKSEIRDSKFDGTLEIITRVSQTHENFIEILLKDTGHGILTEYLDKIFDPFFTTKEVGKGTGLGLSISYGIIKEHKGEIEVAETSKEGTTFLIRLPMRD